MQTFENACLLLARIEGPHPHRNLDIVGHRWALLLAGALVPARTRCRKDAQLKANFDQGSCEFVVTRTVWKVPFLRNRVRGPAQALNRVAGAELPACLTVFCESMSGERSHIWRLGDGP
jgi:hypothetical protein